MDAIAHFKVKTPLMIGNNHSHYLLVLAQKTVVFSPAANTYHVLPGEAHKTVVSLLEKSKNSRKEFLSLFRKHFDLFKDIRGIWLSEQLNTDSQGAEMTGYEERFRSFLDVGESIYQQKFSFRLFILATVGLCCGAILLLLGKFDLLIRGKNVNSGKAPVRFNYDVGYNILLASRILPIRLDCKMIAFSYRFIYKMSGYSCDLAIGILEDPFIAHMWAMSDQNPLGEIPDVLDEFKLIYHSSW